MLELLIYLSNWTYTSTVDIAIKLTVFGQQKPILTEVYVLKEQVIYFTWTDNKRFIFSILFTL